MSCKQISKNNQNLRLYDIASGALRELVSARVHNILGKITVNKYYYELLNAGKLFIYLLIKINYLFPLNIMKHWYQHTTGLCSFKCFHNCHINIGNHHMAYCLLSCSCCHTFIVAYMTFRATVR